MIHPYLPYLMPYDPSFLGRGFEVSLPTLEPSTLAQAYRGGEPLDYIHYSLVLNRRRRLAVYAACNIDGARRVRGISKRPRWQPDPRAESAQTSDRDGYSESAFDHGHLVRRLDVVWGETPKEAKHANDATFFLTNSAPQHKNFNQDEWAELEDWVLERAADNSYRLCVFTGPVFEDDDPRYSELSEEVLERIAPGYRIPKVYWKVIVLRDERGGDSLAAACFAMSQVDAWNDKQGAKYNELKTYQVSLRRIESWCGLRFADAVRRADVLSDHELDRNASVAPVPILSADSIRFRSLASERSRGTSRASDCGCEGPDRIAALEERIAVLAAAVEAATKAQNTGSAAGDWPEAPPVAPPERIASRAIARDWTSVVELATDQHAKARLLEIGASAPRVARQVESADRMAERILGGAPAAAGEFPDCACIELEGRGWQCSGVLIAPRLVLSAAHCDAAGRVTRVLLGGRSVHGIFLESGDVVEAEGSVRHHEYRRGIPGGDLVLVVLAKEAKQAALSIASREELMKENEITAVGFGNADQWGSTGFGEKRKAILPLGPVPPRDSVSAYEGLARTLNYSPRLEFVAGRKGLDIDTCNGDSGGPVYVKIGAEWKLAGITSRATREAGRPCGDGGIYTLVSEYVKWIADVAARHDISFSI
ncbi:DNA/RNA non-specific endonuclease [Sandaracinus amylolyticus]